MSYMHLIYTVPSYSFKINFNSILRWVFEVGSLLQVSSSKLCMYVCSPLHATFPAHLILNMSTRGYKS